MLIILNKKCCKILIKHQNCGINHQITKTIWYTIEIIIIIKIIIWGHGSRWSGRFKKLTKKFSSTHLLMGRQPALNGLLVVSLDFERFALYEPKHGKKVKILIFFYVLCYFDIYNYSRTYYPYQSFFKRESIFLIGFNYISFKKPKFSISISKIFFFTGILPPKVAKLTNTSSESA